MMFRQQTEATTCATIEPTSREGFSCTKSLRVNLVEGRRAVTKRRNTQVLPAKDKARSRQFRRFELQFQRRRTAAETFSRIAEPLWWRTPCLCCPASHHRARCLHRMPARLLDLYLVELG